MAKKRYINTKFWSDNFVSELNPLDRYLFLYFLTNEHTNIAGIYEIPLKTISFETGLDVDMIKKMLLRLYDKVYYIDGWIYIKNFAKHQTDNPSVKKGIEISKSEVPIEILNKINSLSDIDNRLPTDCTQGPGNLNLNLNLNSNLNLKYMSSKEDVYFLEFWNLYPKKELKKKTLEIWKRNKLDSVFKEISVFITEAKKTDRWKKGYVKQPPAFLNGECWKDDLNSYGGANQNNVYKNTDSDNMIEKLKAKQI